MHIYKSKNLQIIHLLEGPVKNNIKILIMKMHFANYMKKRLIFPIGLILFIQFSCTVNDESEPYTSYSRLTNPGKYSYMLDKLPKDVIEICKIAEQQTVHRNLLPYFGIPADKWVEMNNIWPMQIMSSLFGRTM